MTNHIPPEPNLPDKDKTDFLWKVVNRFDFYIGSTNTKAAFLIAFNTFLIGMMTSGWTNILSQFEIHAPAKIFAGFLVAVVIIAALVSLYFTFHVVKPYLVSNKQAKEYHSSVFFKDVAEYANAEIYQKIVLEEKSIDHVRDLAKQAHVLAKGLDSKFIGLSKATNAIIYAQIPSLALLVLTKLIVLFIEICGASANV